MPTSDQSLLTVGGSNDTSSNENSHSVQESGVQFKYCARKGNKLIPPEDTLKIPAASQQKQVRTSNVLVVPTAV
jgi:hypothetical protein